MKQKRLRFLNKLVNPKRVKVEQHRDKFRAVEIVLNKPITDWCEFKVIIQYLENGTFN